MHLLQLGDTDKEMAVSIRYRHFQTQGGSIAALEVEIKPVREI